MDTTTNNRPVRGQLTLEEYQPREEYGSRWLIIPDAEAKNRFGGIPARVATDDAERALELVDGYLIVAMIGPGPSLHFFRLDEVEQALRDGYVL